MTGQSAPHFFHHLSNKVHLQRSTWSPWAHCYTLDLFQFDGIPSKILSLVKTFTFPASPPSRGIAIFMAYLGYLSLFLQTFLGLQKVPSTGPCSFRSEGHGLLLMFSPLGLGTKTCICGCDGMWYHQHVSIIACETLVVSMDDRSSLYLGGPEKDGGQVGFLFFRGKGYNW